MTNLNMRPWELARFTIPQLICLTNEKYAEGQKITSYEQYLEVERRQRLADEAWSKR